MDTFLANAANILEAAEDAAAAHSAAEDWTILLDADGGMRLVAASDWPLDSLAREHNAQSAYRVQRRASRVTLEALQGARSLRLASTPAASAARLLLGI
mgnify:CR=1 FL=1